MLSDSRLRMSFVVKKNNNKKKKQKKKNKQKKNFLLMNSQYINQHNQSTVETVTAISNMFFKQKSEIKHIYTIGVVVIKICAFFYFA